MTAVSERILRDGASSHRENPYGDIQDEALGTKLEEADKVLSGLPEMTTPWPMRVDSFPWERLSGIIGLPELSARALAKRIIIDNVVPFAHKIGKKGYYIGFEQLLAIAAVEAVYAELVEGGKARGEDTHFGRIYKKAVTETIGRLGDHPLAALIHLYEPQPKINNGFDTNGDSKPKAGNKGNKESQTEDFKKIPYVNREDLDRLAELTSETIDDFLKNIPYTFDEVGSDKVPKVVLDVIRFICAFGARKLSEFNPRIDDRIDYITFHGMLVAIERLMKKRPEIESVAHLFVSVKNAIK